MLYVGYPCKHNVQSLQLSLRWFCQKINVCMSKNNKKRLYYTSEGNTLTCTLCYHSKMITPRMAT